MPKLSDWVKESVSGTPGTGTISLGGAFTSAFCKFQDCFASGDKVLYVIQDGNDKEEGVGTLTSGSPWTLARTTVLRTISSGTYSASSPTAISLTSSAVVGIAPSSDSFGVMVGEAYGKLSTSLAISAAIPADNTIPQNTEGTEVVTVTYTPKFADSTLEIRAQVYGVKSTTQNVVLALFRDSTANAISAVEAYMTTGTGGTFGITTQTAASSTASTTFKLRVGAVTGSFFINSTSGSSAVDSFGGVAESFIKVTEIRK